LTNNIIRRIVLYVDKILYELQYDTRHNLTCIIKQKDNNRKE